MTPTHSNNFFLKKNKTFLNYNMQLLKHHKIINTKKKTTLVKIQRF